jgi:predicted pyridoxine 5'-phosphate oxidase superfamily flavin-nucleotide-binding protein
MVVITEEIKNFVNFQKLGYVATVSNDNTPNLSPKGTIIVLDESHLVFADIQSPKTIENLEHNPSIEINVVDPFSRRGYRFKGIAEIISSGDKFNDIISLYKKTGIKSTIKCIVLMKIEKLSEVFSPLYDLGHTEEELKTKWKKYYKI